MTNTITAKQIHNEFYSASIIMQDEKQLQRLGFTALAKIIEVSRLYPAYKIIRKSDIIKVCEKYGLVHTNLWNYAGYIPQKNICDIEKFINNHPPKWYVQYENWQNKVSDIIEFNSKDEAKKHKKRSFLNRYRKYMWGGHDFSICSDTSNLILSQHDIPLYKDPIILLRVPQKEYCLDNRTSNNFDLYVIVTAWGDEASNEKIVNENNN